MRSARPALAARIAALALAAMPLGAAEPPLVVGSKNFAENRLLAEMFAQLLEERAGLVVERRFGLAGTQVCFAALRGAEIDLYPEYTGTGLASILSLPPEADPAATLRRVRREFEARWGMTWLAPLGFENSYEIAVPRALAEELELGTLSDLAAVSGRLSAGLGYEFLERPDGLPGLEVVYGLRFRDVRGLQQTLKYQAVAAGRIDVLDVYTTDGRLAVQDLVILADDRGFFPAYEAAPLARRGLVEERPAAVAAVGLLAGALDAEIMRRLNHRLQEGDESEAAVARDALAELGLVATNDARPGPGAARRGFWRYMLDERATLAARTGEHLLLCAVALVAGILTALPLGLWLERHGGAAEGVIRAVGLLQTVPSIALLAFMIPIAGVGALPAVIALWLYSLFPMLRNTYTGVRDADPEAVDAATALGMTRSQVLRLVRLPLAAPVILAGVRTSAVITVGTATLAAFIGAGGLGQSIVTGLQLADTRLILSGALPAAALAIAVDVTLAGVERAVSPRLRSREAEP